MPKAEKEQVEKRDILQELNSLYGKGTIIRGSEMNETLEVIDSGSISLNKATNLGGIPIGKLIEIFGAESSGKSTICLHIIAEFQKAGKGVLLCDFEQSFDAGYAKALGINMDNIMITQPDCMEDGYNIIERMIKSGKVSLIVIDSHTAMAPRILVDGEVGSATIAVQARINSSALCKIKPLLKENNCTLIGISQTRVSIGSYGDPNIPTGGMAWKFYPDMRFKVSKSIDKGESQNLTTVEIIKNKCAVPFAKATFPIIWGLGVDRIQEVIDECLKKGIIVKGGSWYEMEGNKFQGEKVVKELLRDNPDLFKKLENQIL